MILTAKQQADEARARAVRADFLKEYDGTRRNLSAVCEEIGIRHGIYTRQVVRRIVADLVDDIKAKRI